MTQVIEHLSYKPEALPSKRERKEGRKERKKEERKQSPSLHLSK
jgi:hypothetical protein